jgi:hypothetical protein
MALLFGNRTASARRKDAALELMVQARVILRADDDGAVVSVSEYDCGDPDCGRARTLVLVMRPDQPTEAVKINKPIEAVTPADLAAALAPLAAPADLPSEIRPQRT